MDAVGLKQLVRLRSVGHALQEEGQQGRTLGLGDTGEDRGEVLRVLLAVVRRHLHAQDQHFGTSRLRVAHHGAEVGLGHRRRQAAQGVVAAELDDDDARLVLRQQRR